MVLTADDIAVIRAALRYFGDEMLPHGENTPGDFDRSPVRHYFDRSPVDRSCLCREHVQQLCERLAHVRLHWVRCCTNTDMLLDRRPLNENELATIRHDSGILFATVLISGEEATPTDRR